MKQTTVKKLIVLFCAVCLGILLGIFVLNNNFATTFASAESVLVPASADGAYEIQSSKIRQA